MAEDTPQKLQSRLAGVQRVIIKVSGDNDGLDQILNQVPGVKQVMDVKDKVDKVKQLLKS